MVVSALVSLMIASVAMLVLLWNTEERRHEASAEGFAYAPRDGGDLPRLWQAPSFSLTDQHRREVTLGSLRGEPFIADFIYTQCTSACPMLTSRMVMLQRSLAGMGVRFVSFSVDPAHDTPDVLATYAAQWNQQETRWTLLSTTDSTLADISSGFRVAAEKTHDEKSPILHSDLFFLVDADGFVRGVYPSDAGDSLARLASDASRLSGAAPAGPDDASTPPPRNLYASLGCGGCHDNPKLAPPLVNLRGGERMLQDGSKVTIDDAYLRRSILEPGAEVVTGYAPLMPSYRHYLSNAQVDALVAEVDARIADGGPGNANVAVLVDPVCGMKVRAVPEAPHVTVQGKEVYFCSDTCRDEFTKHPSRYPYDPLAGMAEKADR